MLTVPTWSITFDKTVPRSQLYITYKSRLFNFRNFTYALHLEALNTLLVLLSVQMYQPQPASKFKIYKYMMEGKW